MIDQIDIQNNTEPIIDFGGETKTNIIKVIGVGGGGGNAVNHMHEFGIVDVDFIVANTDSQALGKSNVPLKIQLGVTLTEGLGAGNNPEKGKNAANESIEDICKIIDIPEPGKKGNTKMLFVTAGMGGGTGTGAAPVIAKAAKDAGILTVGIVTVPFTFEGPKRVSQAIAGLNELKDNVDSLLVIDNNKILEQYGDMGMKKAFGKADDVLTMAAKGIAEIITVNGTINVDFADVETVLKDSGIALMGTGIGEGENRALDCIKNALSSPLLSNSDIKGAKNMLINIFSSTENEITMRELNMMSNYVQKMAGCRGDLIWGASTDETLGGRISVTLVVSGFKFQTIMNPYEDGGTFDVDSPMPFILATNEDLPEEEEKEKEEEGHKSGEEVDLGEIDETIYDDEEENSDSDEQNDSDSDEEQMPQTAFQPKDMTSLPNMEEYENTPAYQRKGIKLNIGAYTDPKCTKTIFNETLI